MKRWRSLILLLLLTEAPLGILFPLWFDFHQRKEEQLQKAKMSHARKYLLTSRFQLGSKTLFMKAAQGIKQAWQSGTLTKQWNPPDQDRQLLKLLGLQVGIYTPGKPMWSPTWAKITYRFLWKSLWQDITAGAMSKKQLDRYRALFGGTFSRIILEGKELPILCRSRKGDGYLW